MYTLFVILIVIAALLMIGVVLIQESKGGGLSSNFSSSNAIMGVRKTTDFIEKTTWGLAIAMVVISVASAYVAPTANTDESVIEKAATEGNTQTRTTCLISVQASRNRLLRLHRAVPHRLLPPLLHLQNNKQMQKSTGNVCLKQIKPVPLHSLK